MSKELEAFDRLRLDIGKPLCYARDTKIYEDIACVRKALESIEIIKKNTYITFDSYLMHLKEDEDQVSGYTIILPDTKEEFEILKEVFVDDEV